MSINSCEEDLPSAQSSFSEKSKDCEDFDIILERIINKNGRSLHQKLVNYNEKAQKQIGMYTVQLHKSTIK